MNKRLLFYINAINGGGAERVMLQLAGHFSEAGFECRILTSFVDNSFEYEVPTGVKRDSIEQDEIKDSKVKKNIRRIGALRKYCKNYKPDLLISFMAEPNFRAIIATRGLRVKTLVSVRNDPNREYFGSKRYIGKILLSMADGCVFQTEDAKKWFPQKLQKKSRIILNEVSRSFFGAQRDKDARDIIAIGRLYKQKNYEFLIRSFLRIADKYVDERLLIYGEGYQRTELERLIKENNLENRVVLMGQTADVVSALKRAKIYILSSDYEGMPNSLMEALAVGLPCISTDCPCGGPRMLINDKENGILVKPGDEIEMSRAMQRLIENEDLRITLGEKARESAKKYYPETIFSEWRSYVLEICK